MVHCFSAPEFTTQVYLLRTLLVSQEWAGEEKSHAHRAHDSVDFPPGRRVFQTKYLGKRHERDRASPGFKAKFWLKTFLVMAACSWLWTSPTAARSVALAKFIHMQPTMMEPCRFRHGLE